MNLPENERRDLNEHVAHCLTRLEIATWEASHSSYTRRCKAQITAKNFNIESSLQKKGKQVFPRRKDHVGYRLFPIAWCGPMIQRQEPEYFPPALRLPEVQN